MSEKTIRFKVFRYKPGAIDPPRHDTFEVTVGPRTTVLDALEIIRVDDDPTLMYRHSCHHASCGTCAYKINGREALGCVTHVLELNTDEVSVEPLDGLPGSLTWWLTCQISTGISPPTGPTSVIASGIRKRRYRQGSLTTFALKTASSAGLAFQPVR